MPVQSQAKRRATEAPDKPIKRTRVSRACDQCRLAREKCNGAQPICSTCSGSKRSCTYTANVKKRGIQPGYIRALELALALLFQHDPENERLVNSRLAQGGQSSLLLSRDSKEANKLHKKWRKARFYTEVDKLLSGGEPSRHDHSEPLSSDSGDDSDKDESSTHPTTISGIQSSNTTQSQPILPDRLRVEDSGIYRQPIPTEALIPMPLDSWRLLEVYFTYTQCWFPVCEKHDLLKLSYSYPPEGMKLSPILPESGTHAELWSILAVASMHQTSDVVTMGSRQRPSTTSKQFYATTKLLIPDEIGRFDLGHVKALLNLAIFNMAQSLNVAAWILVGYASRILEAIDQSILMMNSRRRHVFYGCYMLDSILALQLNRQTHFTKNKLDQLGTIDEDGLDEWQPWTGGLSSIVEQPKTPLLALSSFNALLGVLDILSNQGQTSPNLMQRFEDWKKSLPRKLSYISLDTAATPLTPPAVLLQLSYYCTALTLLPSPSWLLQSLDILERAIDGMSLKNLPPAIKCIMDIIVSNSATFVIDQRVQQRLRKLQNALHEAWPSYTSESQLPNQQPSPAQLGLAAGFDQMPTPMSAILPPQQSYRRESVHSTLSPFDSSFSDAHSAKTVAPSGSSFPKGQMPMHTDPGYSNVSGDLENFFDELASLDTANNFDNQPQFMQNLGFAADANMAELFSEYIPLQSSTFVPLDDPGMMSLDQYGFYDTR